MSRSMIGRLNFGPLAHPCWAVAAYSNCPTMTLARNLLLGPEELGQQHHLGPLVVGPRSSGQLAGKSRSHHLPPIGPSPKARCALPPLPGVGPSRSRWRWPKTLRWKQWMQQSWPWCLAREGCEAEGQKILTNTGNSTSKKYVFKKGQGRRGHERVEPFENECMCQILPNEDIGIMDIAEQFLKFIDNM